MKIELVQKGLNFRIGSAAGKFYNRKYSTQSAKENWNLLKDKRMAKFGDTAYQFTTDEITKISNVIEDFIRWDTVSGGFMHSEFIGNGIRDIEFYRYVDVQAPRLTQTFTRGTVVYTAKEKVTTELIGFDYDMYFDVVSMDAMTNPNVAMKFTQNLWDGTKDQLIKSLVQYKEHALHFGTAVTGLLDVGIKGWCNTSGINAPANISQGGDDLMTTIGDVYHAATILATSLILDKHKPPFTLHMSPGVYVQGMQNVTAATGISDLNHIFNLGKDVNNPIFNKIIMNPYLLANATETTTTGAMGVTKDGEQNMSLKESYPIGYYPLPPTGLGSEGKILWMGVMEVKQPTSIAFRNALTTNTV